MNSVPPSFSSPCTSFSANLTMSPAVNSFSSLPANSSFPEPCRAYQICSEASCVCLGWQAPGSRWTSVTVTRRLSEFSGFSSCLETTPGLASSRIETFFINSMIFFQKYFTRIPRINAGRYTRLCEMIRIDLSQKTIQPGFWHLPDDLKPGLLIKTGPLFFYCITAFYQIGRIVRSMRKK